MELDPQQDPFSREAVQHLVARYGSPLLVIDAERVRQQYRRLKAALPGVDLHYALKPLPHSSLIVTLMSEGAFFDLATNGEVELVRRLGVAPDRCIHTHPIKRDSDIRTALSFGVNRFVVDNPDELRKFVQFRNRASLLIRVSFRSPGAQVDLSRKFGCDPEAATALLQLATDLHIKIDGLSFHTGSQNANPSMIVKAIDVCRDLLRSAAAAGHDAHILDIGGGFPVDYLQPAMPIEEFCAPINAALGKLPAGIRLIAEPGRFISAPSAVAVSSVMGRALRDGHWWYYLDDGLYGSYSGQMYDHSIFPIEALQPGSEKFPSVLAGPTCDSIDVIREKLALPKLDIGDLVMGRSMGAYTWASASEFNFFSQGDSAGVGSWAVAARWGRRVISRRTVLATGLVGTAAWYSRALLGAQSSTARRLALTNLHTGERLEVEYFRDGAYVPQAMASLEQLLRDFRNGEKHAIDPKLMDYLVDVAALAGKAPDFSVISGYRSPQTNEKLHERSSGVSQHSLHMQGRAMDVRMSGMDCKDLAERAEELKRGGVGFYRASNFVHLDTGAFRTWRG